MISLHGSAHFASQMAPAPIVLPAADAREGAVAPVSPTEQDGVGGDAAQRHSSQAANVADESQRAKNQAQHDPAELSDPALAQIRDLKARDKEVRAHEAAHATAAGGLAIGGPSYSYKRGPDQRLYAVAGEVQIDTSKVAGDPAATLQKAETIRRAALAPASPSAQDRAVAAAATQMAIEAQAELAATAQQETTDQSNDVADGESGEKSVAQTGTEAKEASATCPSCGGAHASHAHEAMSAYAEHSQTR